MTSLVTFDFHNTIAYCDEWFWLEIRDLPVRVLDELSPETFRKHSRDGITAAYRTLRQEVMASGKEVDAEDGVLRVLSALDVNVSGADVADAIAGLMRQASQHASPVPGAVESIREIASTGISVGVISSAVYHPFLDWTLASFGIANELSFVITSASSGIYKSNPDIYRAALQTVNVPAAAGIHVGDSAKWDVWSAKQAGMRAILFANGDVDPLVDRPVETTPDHIVHAMGDVAPWILTNLDS